MELDLLAAARDLIAADSVSAHGNLGAVAVLESIAASLGLEGFRQEAEALGTQHANVIVHPRGTPARDGALLLVTHTDTVGPGPLDLWTVTPPFQLAQDGDALFGLGVADVKLDALAKLQALARAPASARGKVAFCGTFAEEVGCLGARYFVEHPPFRPGFVSCGEPSELVIIDAHKGYLVARIAGEATAAGATGRRVRLVFSGKAAHSSTPHLGVSAIAKALAFCDANGLAVHAADGGDLANKVAARCAVEVDDAPGLAEAAAAAGAVREEVPAPGASAAAAVAAARELAAELSRLVAALEPRLDARFDPATTVFNNGVLRAGGGRVELTCDARLLPGHDPEAIFRSLDEAAGRISRTRGIHLEVERDRSNPAMALPPHSRLRDAAVEAARAQGLDPIPRAKPTNTEGGVFVAAGIEAIVFGPGRSTGNAHTANERQSLSQIAGATRFYEQLIRTLCA